jgi:predicted nucleic acid-binding protein
VIFADTSFLLSLAGNDSNSPAATAHVKTLHEAIRITALNRLEFENAIRLLLFRKVLPETEAATAMTALATDEETGRIAETLCDWTAILNEAMRISREKAGEGGHRAMDILHVAAALKSGATEFLSFDGRQRKLAAAEGLTVGPQITAIFTPP